MRFPAMPRALRGLFLAGCLAAAAPAVADSAQDVAVEQVVQGVESTYQGVEGIRADFVQTTRDSMGGEIVQKGNVSVQRPKRMRWEFKGASGDSAVVSDGATMWVWTGANNQVIVTPELSANTDDGMGNLLTGLDKLDELFDVKMLGDASGPHLTLELVPKTPQGNFEKLHVAVTAADYKLQSVTVFQPFGASVQLDFSGMELNPGLPAQHFAFQVPAGATVVNAGEL